MTLRRFARCAAWYDTSAIAHVNVRRSFLKAQLGRRTPSARRIVTLQAKGGSDQDAAEKGEGDKGKGKEEPGSSSKTEAEAVAAATAAVLADEPSTDTIQAAAEAATTEEEAAKKLEAEPVISPALQAIYDQCQTWQWKGQHKINYVKIGTGPPIVLVHGFGASLGHWRKNIPVLSKTHTVYAVDMIGYGRSEKPAGFVYTMETWAEQLQDFLTDVVRAPTILMGNSLGSLTALIAAAEGGPELVKGCVLVNCAGGMNNKAIADDWRVAMLLPVFWFIDFLLAQEKLAGGIFNRFRTSQNIQTVLRSVYVNEAAVDRELVEIISRPAGDEGALHAFCSILSGPPGPRPEKLLPRISTPILLVWGDTDTFIPVDGPIGRFFTALPKTNPNVELTIISGGHCPHDDKHELFHDAVLPWLEKVSAGRKVLVQS
ncbi:alpha/beta hydrolase superfamily [Klebsormidium nitens]|uniref:Alpha/beta hydrolase superfamily n=1 Tax=Klebsormidium nitens TaxID=105231 RepID=A0A1Y1HXD3_KLENI|nr:alpha/beta hydrolase superfamily [Klebsormidium nitens]|eukprot:GAQ80518.1 alpha/beta hydrolase superfamily [Klebsormidium nitens]